MLLLRKSICTGAIHLPLCFSMSHGFLARSRASIRSAAENCYRRNSLPPLNNLNQAETRSAASRLRRFCAVKCFCSAKAFAQGAIHLPLCFSMSHGFQKRRDAERRLFFFGAGYGSRTRLRGLGSRCTTDVRTLRFRSWVSYHLFFKNATVFWRKPKTGPPAGGPIGDQQSFAPAGMASFSMRRFSFSSPFSL